MFRALNRDELETKPDPVDYLETVGLIQEAGRSVVYPPSLPDGWIATSLDFTPGERTAWGLGFLTDDEEYVGLRQEDASLDDLLTTYVDESPKELAEAEIPGSVADDLAGVRGRRWGHGVRRRAGRRLGARLRVGSSDELESMVESRRPRTAVPVIAPQPPAGQEAAALR